MQRVLDSIGWWHHIGIESVQRGHAAVTAGLSPKASTFGVYTSKLSDLGYVETAGPGAIRLTESGKRRAHPPADAKVLDMAMAKVSNRAAEALRFVADRYPESISRDEIADQMCLSRTASTLGVYLSESSKLGFIETDGPGRVRAADFLFAGH
ncbi:hypothetical protein [Oricola sp.]|uniref:hypothetical protein n=1 Tax=Oricola sp. TaxID=1979950 RepID=UPI003BA954BE